MDRFVIQEFREDGLVDVKSVDLDQSLLNDFDLEGMTNGMDRDKLFIRRQFDTNNGYFIKDGRWDYGTRDIALIDIRKNYG